MQPDPAQRNFGLPNPGPSDTRMREHERRWLSHVQAGRIGAPAIPPEQEQDFLRRMAQMERAVLGEVRSVKRAG